MIPWKLLDTAQTPGDGSELRLYERDNEFSIKVGNYELMNSRVYGSEDALGKLGCQKFANHPRARGFDRRSGHGLHREVGAG